MNTINYSQWPMKTTVTDCDTYGRRLHGGYGYRFKEAYETYMVREITSSISEELPPGLPKEVLEGISTAAYVTTFVDCIAFVKTLQRH